MTQKNILKNTIVLDQDVLNAFLAAKSTLASFQKWIYVYGGEDAIFALITATSIPVLETVIHYKMNST